MLYVGTNYAACGFSTGSLNERHAPIRRLPECKLVKLAANGVEIPGVDQADIGLVVIFGGAVHRVAIVPHQHVADLPLVAIDEAILRCESD